MACGLLAAVAAVSGAGIAAEPLAGWREPLLLWLCLVGGPSSGKTPALAAARRLLEPVERALAQKDAGRRRAHDAAAERARGLRERWKLAASAAARSGRRIPRQPAGARELAPFVPAQLVVGDTTLAALADVIAGNPGGVVMWRDELAAWLAGLARAPGDRAAWLEAWSAAPVAINRRSRGEPLRLPRFPVSVLGALQPERLGALLAADDGLAARFLYAWPQPAPWRPLAERTSRSAAPSDVAQRLQRIAALARSPEKPLVLKFRRDAVAAFDAFCARCHDESLQAAPLVAGFLGKAPGSVARLAAIVALLGWSEAPGGLAIDTAAAEAAIALWRDYFRPHALAALGSIGERDDIQVARARRWLRTSGATVVSRDDIRSQALARTVDASGADRVIGELERIGVLSPLALSSIGAGRPARRWEVVTGNTANTGNSMDLGAPASRRLMSAHSHAPRPAGGRRSQHERH